MVELMIVIAIIGVLAVALIPTLLGNQVKARDTTRMAQLKTISSALDGYQLDNNIFPYSSWTTYVAGKSFCVSNSAWVLAFSGWSAAVGKYIKWWIAPVAPGNTTQSQNDLCGSGNPSYGYRNLKLDNTSGDQTSYVLVAKMEDTTKGNFTVPSTLTGTAVDAATYKTVVNSTGASYALFY